MNSKSKLLQHLQTEVFCRLRPSGSHGVGVFAVKDIPAHTNPFQGAFTGEYEEILDQELQELPEGVQAMIKAYCVQENGKWLIPSIGLNAVDISFFINHSKTPNVATSDGENFFTTRVIKEGEELFSDYDSYSEGLQAST